MRTLYISMLLLFSGLITFSQEYNQHVQDIIDEVTLDSLIYELRNLSGEDPVMINGELTTIEHRVSNWGNDLAADYIFQTLEGYGLQPVNQVYSNGGRNVFAIQEGTEYPDEYYMICAHYDAVDFYCADDNASGTAAVLEAARIFSGMQFEYSVIYALWDEEEIGLIGSNYYATQAAINDDIIHAVINMDMISWDGDDDMVAEIHSSYLASSNQLSTYIVAVDNLYELAVSPAVQIPGTTASDHSRFWNNGYAAVLLIEEYYGGDFNPYYHSENDRIGILHMPYFHEMSKLSIGSLASMAMPVVETTIAGKDALAGFSLSNHPNPFIGQTNVKITLEEECHTRLFVTNSMGQLVSDFFDGTLEHGTHQFTFDAGNQPQGLYFIHMQVPGGVYSHKILVK